VQHAVDAQVVDEDEVADRLGRDVDARHRAADDAIVRDRLRGRRRIETQLDVPVAHEVGVADRSIARAHNAVVDRQRIDRRVEHRRGALDEIRAGLRRREPERLRMKLDRRARDRRALVRRPRRVAHDHLDLRHGHVEFLGDDLGQCRSDAGAEVDVPVQRDHAPVVPDRQQQLVAFDGIGLHGRRLAARRRRHRRHVADHEQHAGRIAEVATRPKVFGSIHAAATACITARTISMCVPQRQRLCDNAALTSADVGCGFSSSSATTVTIMPFRQ
jgi:hypothetical protein